MKIYVYIVLLLFILLNLILYTNIVPLYHEEPRRALIAEEMLLSNNFIKPTVLKETYLKKPPFHNWCIALTSLKDKYISNFDARLPSILSYIVLSIILLLFPNIKKYSIEASTYILISFSFIFSYALKAEPDMLFTTLLFISFLFYVKNNNFLCILISSLFMSLSILTKGISPIFFYPPLFIYFLFYEKDKIKGFKNLLIHFSLSLILPIIWLLLLSFQTNIISIINTTYSEIFLRDSINYKKYIGHLLTFPLRAIMATMPISLLLLFSPKKQNIIRDKLYILSFFLFLWMFIILWLYPSGKGRYFLPAIPFFCILASYHIDTQKLFNKTIKKTLLIIFASSLVIAIPFYLYHRFYIQTLIFILTLIFIFYYYNKAALNVLMDTILLTLICTVIFFHGPYFYKKVVYFNYEGQFNHIVKKIKNTKEPIFFDNTTKKDLKLAFFISRSTQKQLGILDGKLRNKYYLFTYKGYTNCSIIDHLNYKNYENNSNILIVYQCK